MFSHALLPFLALNPKSKQNIKNPTQQNKESNNQ
jgi:hypothetical protein